jgi:hypothetical protein
VIVQEKNITKTKTILIISESSRKNITKTKTKRIISDSSRKKYNKNKNELSLIIRFVFVFVIFFS